MCIRDSYITNLAQLKENAMAMRQVLGAGQGSDEMRAAITATLPTPRTPTRAYASTALDKFEGQLNRLSRGLLNVPLSPEAQPPTPGTVPSSKATTPTTISAPPPSDVKMIGVHEFSDGSRAYWDGKQWLNRKP